MTPQPIRVYLAAPFFTPQQIHLCERIEHAIRIIDGFKLYSPREDGVLTDVPPADRAKHTRRIFDLNCFNIKDADVVVAVVDGRDVGVMWEIGYAYAHRTFMARPRIVTYTDHDYGLNVMIQECVDAHCRGISEVHACLSRQDYASYRRFSEEVT